ncbi:MAG: type II CAAX endopeptidase family protein [Bacteroidales bacterium]|nr:type II CAAX endopeptidase family protein [Bacteroidales bacterium]
MFNKLKYYLPGVAESWLLIIILILGGSIFAALFNISIAILLPSLSSVAEILSYPLIFVPPAIFIFFSLKKSFLNITSEDYTPPYVELDRANFGKLGIGVSFILIFLMVFSINIITEPLTYWMGIPDFLEEFMGKIHSNAITTFLSVVIFASILEELFCRGVILRALLYHTSPAKAIILSAFMFGIIHLNPWQAIPAFILGVFMGWIYWRTHSLWATIFIHFVNNGFSYFVTILFPDLPAHFGFVDIIPNRYYYIIYAVSLLYTVTVILIMNKNYDKTISIKIPSHS